jgi:hypothetical protein
MGRAVSRSPEASWCAPAWSSSPLLSARSSISVPAAGLTARPRVASFSLLSGLWMRWLASRM